MKNFEKYFKYLDNIENWMKNSSTQRPNKVYKDNHLYINLARIEFFE